jgi:hypothetical protein
LPISSTPLFRHQPLQPQILCLYFCVGACFSK